MSEDVTLKRRTDVVYLYQHAARELDIACAVSALLSRHHGIHVEIAHWRTGVRQLLGVCQPKVVVLPFCYCKEDYALPLLAWRKAAFLNLAAEQLLSSATKKSKTPQDNFCRNHVVHQAWNPDFREFLASCNVPNENVFTNGNPTYMLLKEPYSRAAISRMELSRFYNLREDLPWLLFPENYGWAFYSDEELHSGPILRGMSREEAFGIRDYSQKSLKVALEWCVRLASEKRIELILRPRPATPNRYIEKEIQKQTVHFPKNLHIRREHSVRDWILASDFVMSSYSTTLVEAAVAAKPAAMLSPFPIPPFLLVSWNRLVNQLHSYEMLEEFILNSKEPVGLKAWAESELLSVEDPIQSLCQKILAILKGVGGGQVLKRSDAISGNRFGRNRFLLSLLFEYRRMRWRTRGWGADLPVTEYAMDSSDLLGKQEIADRKMHWHSVLFEPNATV
ncbi:MAG: hypothetical protein ACK5PB_21800 [Pirellula sp.]|jgi:surface carbohydrate biosynthesis protein